MSKKAEMTKLQGNEKNGGFISLSDIDEMDEPIEAWNVTGKQDSPKKVNYNTSKNGQDKISKPSQAALKRKRGSAAKIRDEINDEGADDDIESIISNLGKNIEMISQAKKKKLDRSTDVAINQHKNKIQTIMTSLISLPSQIKNTISQHVQQFKQQYGKDTQSLREQESELTKALDQYMKATQVLIKREEEHSEFLQGIQGAINKELEKLEKKEQEIALANQELKQTMAAVHTKVVNDRTLQAMTAARMSFMDT